MTDSVVVALIASGASLAGNLLVAIPSMIKTRQQMNANTENMLYRMDQLEKKQDKHNSVIERMFIAEKNICILDEREKELQKQLDDLK